MNFANRINQLLAASIGVVNAVLAIILILSMVGGQHRMVRNGHWALRRSTGRSRFGRVSLWHACYSG